MLPAAPPRKEIHSRRIVCRGYLRDDGLWDIEAELLDTKGNPFALHMRMVPAGDPIHLMAIRLTVDDELSVKDVLIDQEHIPYPKCLDAAAPMRRLIGKRIGPGWRQAIQDSLGGNKGCAHLRDMLNAMAPVAYQTVPTHLDQAHVFKAKAALEAGEKAPWRTGPPPFFINQCLGFAFDSTVTETYEPAFFRWNERPENKKPT